MPEMTKAIASVRPFDPDALIARATNNLELEAVVTLAITNAVIDNDLQWKRQHWWQRLFGGSLYETFFPKRMTLGEHVTRSIQLWLIAGERD